MSSPQPLKTHFTSEAILFLQDTPADGVGHGEQLLLANEAELRLVLVRKADRQLRSLHRVAETGRLDAEVQHLLYGSTKICCRVPVTPCMSTMMMRWVVKIT